MSSPLMESQGEGYRVARRLLAEMLVWFNIEPEVHWAPRTNPGSPLGQVDDLVPSKVTLTWSEFAALALEILP